MTKGSAESAGMNAARLERIGPVMQAYVDRGTYAGIITIIARRVPPLFHDEAHRLHSTDDPV